MHLYQGESIVVAQSDRGRDSILAACMMASTDVGKRMSVTRYTKEVATFMKKARSNGLLSRAVYEG